MVYPLSSIAPNQKNNPTEQVGSEQNGTKLRLLAWSFDRLATLTAALLTARDVDRAQLATTITRMDAGVEPPWTVSRRVVVNCARFMSRTHANMA